MPNITILKISTRKKRVRPYAAVLTIILVVIIMVWALFKLFSSFQFNTFKEAKNISCLFYKNLISLSIPIGDNLSFIDGANYFNNYGKLQVDIGTVNFKYVLEKSLPFLYFYKIDNNSDIKLIEPKKVEKNKTEDIEENENKNKIYLPTVTIKSGNVSIKNHTKYKVDIEKLKKEPLNFSLSNKDVQVIILHTHTTEGYFQKSKEKNNLGNYRTNNPLLNVTFVGNELGKQISEFGIKSYHDKTVHDYPEYIGAYTRSLQTARKDMKKNPKANIILDIHRDGYDISNGPLKASVKINKKDSAKIMFVVGTDELGLKHSNWVQNLKFAIKLQNKANELYPGLCRDIDLRKERFNQHCTSGALIVEVGGTGNTIEEAQVSMSYLAKVIYEVMKEK